MQNFKLTLEYDGSRYAGWQWQQKEKTIAGEVLRAAEDLFKQKPNELYGAGRTDAGVHALGQVAHLKVNSTKLSPEKILEGLNDRLPTDINILKVESVPVTFHARHDAKSRAYIYVLSKRRDAFARKHAWWVKEPLNLKAMIQAAAKLQGFHDFRSFSYVKDKKQSTLVDLTTMSVEEEDHRVLIRMEASHFLWKMVRRIVGVLVEVGRGNLSIADVEQFLQISDDTPGKYTAPPHGLFLERVDY
jgi:tRNA pseudouridine38-40 synthase